MTDRQLLVDLRAGLLGIAAVEGDLNKKRSLLNMAASIQQRLREIDRPENISVIPSHRPPIRRDDSVS